MIQYLIRYMIAKVRKSINHDSPWRVRVLLLSVVFFCVVYEMSLAVDNFWGAELLPYRLPALL